MTNPDSYNPNVPSDWRRVGAFIIDCLPWAILGEILMFFLADQGSDYSGPLGTDIPTGPELIISLSGIVLLLVSRILMEVKSGASLGRLATGTKVIDERTGQTISPLNSLIRNAWIPLSWVLAIFVPLGGVLVFAFYIAMAITINRHPEGQSFLDQSAKAIVVNN